MQFKPIDDNPYFDLTTKSLDEISIFENTAKTSCFVADANNKGHIYKGFKLSQNKQIDVCCGITFYPSKATGKYIPRPTFFKANKQFQVKENAEKKKTIVDLNDSQTAANFWKMIEFLQKFKELVDIGDFEKSYSVVSKDAYVVEFKSKTDAEKVQDLKELFAKTDFSETEIAFILEEDRKRNLESFSYLLEHKNSWEIYYKKYKDKITGSGEESVWHHFLKKHHWILGLNTDLRFIRDFITEADIGIKDTSGKGSPSVDLLGISDFTTLVELKTPNTSIFTGEKKSTARANTWSFSKSFIDGVSQCLAQKASWERNFGSKPLVVGKEVIDQNRYRTIDPKAVLIIGNKKQELPEDSHEVDVLQKRDTFEMFRRNNRNLDIITYDELYERAHYLVLSRKAV